MSKYQMAKRHHYEDRECFRSCEVRNSKLKKEEKMKTVPAQIKNPASIIPEIMQPLQALYAAAQLLVPASGVAVNA